MPRALGMTSIMNLVEYEFGDATVDKEATRHGLLDDAQRESCLTMEI